jgi:hypothetical protein
VGDKPSSIIYGDITHKNLPYDSDENKGKLNSSPIGITKQKK